MQTITSGSQSSTNQTAPQQQEVPTKEPAPIVYPNSKVLANWQVTVVLQPARIAKALGLNLGFTPKRIREGIKTEFGSEYLPYGFFFWEGDHGGILLDPDLSEEEQFFVFFHEIYHRLASKRKVDQGKSERDAEEEQANIFAEVIAGANDPTCYRTRR